MPHIKGDRTSSVVGAAVSSMVIGVTFFILRILSRIVSKSRILWSDILLFGGVIACVVISSIDLYGKPQYPTAKMRRVC